MHSLSFFLFFLINKENTHNKDNDKNKNKRHRV